MVFRKTKSLWRLQPAVTCAVLERGDSQHLGQDPNLSLALFPPATHPVSFSLSGSHGDLRHSCSSFSCPHPLLGGCCVPQAQLFLLTVFAAELAGGT